MELEAYVAHAAALAGVDLAPERARVVAAALEPLLAALDGLRLTDAEPRARNVAEDRESHAGKHGHDGPRAGFDRTWC
jgi:hypothetical protein